VFIYHKPSFAGREPPATRAELIAYLQANADAIHGRVGTYYIDLIRVGFMFLSRDQEQYSDLWTLVGAMGAAGSNSTRQRQRSLNAWRAVNSCLAITSRLLRGRSRVS